MPVLNFADFPGLSTEQSERMLRDEGLNEIPSQERRDLLAIVRGTVAGLRTGASLWGILVTRGEEGGVLVEDGQAAARACAINLIAQVKAALGDLDRVVRVVRLNGFINSAPSFLDGPKVMNGASDLIVEVFGEKGRHTRTTVGVAVLPNDAAVEVDGVFEVV